MLHRHAGKAGAVFPDELVGLALALGHFARAAGKHHDVGAAVHQGAAVFTRAHHAADPLEDIAPDGDLVMHAVGQAAYVDALALVDLVAQQRHIKHAVNGVVADKQGGALGVDVVQAGHPGAVPQAVHGQQAPHGFCGWRCVIRQSAFGASSHNVSPGTNKNSSNKQYHYCRD